MRVRKSGTLLAAVVAAAVATLTLNPAPLAAQEAVIKGKVTSETGEPLGGANVVVANTNLGAITAANGTFTLTIGASAARGQQVTLTARYIGHKPVTRTVTLSSGEQEQNFQLAADPLRLEEVVVTGVGEATDRRKLPNVVASVNADQLQAVPGTSALQAVEGKVAGVRLVPNSAQPGGEPSLRLRGATSIGGRQDPLYIVDGVITRFGLADIAGEDVERVELVKGAAASAMYGSDAANGVVQVFTKRGASLPEGGIRVTTRVEGGVNNMPTRMEFSHHHAFEINETPSYCTTLDASYTVSSAGNYCLTSSGARVIRGDQIAKNPFTVYYDHWNSLVNNGQFWTGYASVGQRQGNTNFNASFEETRNKGVIFGLGGYNRQNFRLNLDQQVRSNVDASFSAFYGTSTNGRAAEGQTGPFFGLMFLQPDVNIEACCNPDGSKYVAQVPLSGDVANDFNPLYELAYRKIDQDRNRFSGSGRMRWRINTWLQGEGTFAYDQEAQTYSDMQPFGYLNSSGSKTAGSLFQSSKNDWQSNAGVTLTSIRRFGSSISNTTKIAAIFENQRNRLLQSNAGGFVVARVPEFGTGTDPNTVTSASTDERIRNENFYAVSTFDIKDRYIIDGLVRRDGSSLFGPESRWATYYRVSGAWRLTQDMHIPGVDEMRLRASYGTAGLRPAFADQYEILAVTPGGFTKQILGNPLLKPARSAELEVGTNIDFGGSRYTLEYTYAQKKTTDQILLVDLPAVAGFSQQWQNTGALRSRTHELTFAARVINKPGTQLTLNIVGDRTRQVITSWTLPERLYSFEQMPAAFFLGNNSDLGAMYGNHWVRNIDELYADPDKAAQSGAGQTWSRDSVMVNEDGYVVRKDVYGTPNERAIKYVYCKTFTGPTCTETSNITKIGDANPDFNMSFGFTLNVKRFAINALMDWSYGGQLYNGTRQWAFQATRDRVQDQFGKPNNDAGCGTVSDPMPSCPQKALPYYGVGFYNGLDPNDFFVESGSYAKLKELAVHYTLGPSQLRAIGLRGLNEIRLGIIGRNVFTITKYSGLDPEVSGLFGDPFQVRMDWFQYPQFRTMSAVVEITY